jgi:hypothetical protein
MPERILRERECCLRLACGKTKFRTDYRPRLTRVALGKQSFGYIESSVERLINELVAETAAAPPQPRNPNLRPELSPNRTKQTKRRHRSEARAS